MDELRFWLKWRPSERIKNKGTVSKKAIKLIDVFHSSHNNKGFCYCTWLKGLDIKHVLFHVEVRRFNAYFCCLPFSAQLTGVLVFP